MDNITPITNYPKDYECQVCDTLMLEPIILPDCGHTFCKTCISRVQQNPTTSHCPLCKKPIWSSTQLKTNFTLKKLVEKIEVKCTACNERGSIEVVARHTCPDALVSCSNRGCQRSIKRKDEPTHKEECLYAVISCEQCHQNTTVANKELHLEKTCIRGEIRCPLKCRKRPRSVSRFSSTTEGSQLLRGRHRRRRRRPRMPRVQRCSSFSTITESTMSLNIITVTLNMEKVNFLGISIVGQSNKRGDGGIYVGSIMKGGAVDLDGRIEPGDMLLQVNDVNFENMSNDDAVRVLREMVHKPGPITLTVAKCWDPTPKGYFTLPPSPGEPVRPIDTSAWVQHTTAMTQFGPTAQYGKQPNSQSLTTMTSTSSSMTSSLPESDRYTELQEGEGLSVTSDMTSIVKTMAAPESGLDIRDRMWLKITIPNAFIGSDVVDWLYSHVEGFQDRREARKYACNLLKAGFIRHTVNKITFSEQCYYVFGDLCGNMAALTINEHEGDGDQDTLGPLPTHQAISWIAGPPSYGYHQMPSYPGPPPQAIVDTQTPGYAQSFYSAHSGSQSPHSASGSSRKSGGGGDRADGDHRSSGGSSSEKSSSSKGKSKEREARSVEGSAQLVQGPPPAGVPMPGGPPMPGIAMMPRPLDQVPENISASRNSFRMAMGNPCEFFVDVM